MTNNEEKVVAIYEDAKVLANIAAWSVELQVHRLRADRQEIPDFVMQPVVDFHLLVTVLTRLRKAAEMVAKISDISDVIRQFDDSLPDLKSIRNIQEHIDEYRLGNGRNKKVDPAALLTVVLDHDRLAWLDYELRVDDARRASASLFQAIVDNPPPAYVDKVKQFSENHRRNYE